MDWKFLRATLKSFDFLDSWINLTMECVSSTYYFIIANGESMTIVKYLQGIRQEDLLAPFLFLLCIGMLNQI